MQNTEQLFAIISAELHMDLPQGFVQHDAVLAEVMSDWADDYYGQTMRNLSPADFGE